MDQDFSQDDEYVVGWDGDDNTQTTDQSQDDMDAEAVLHSRYNYLARKRLGLVGREEDGSVLMGSEDLARNLQQHSPPPADLQQNFNNILQQYNDPDMPPPSPAFHKSDAAHLLPGHGDYSPKPNLQVASNSPALAYSPSGRHHAPIDSPGSGGRLTAASQATGAALRAGHFRPQSAAPVPPILGAGGVVVAGGIEVDEELINAYQLQQATSPPNTKKRENRRFQHQQPGYRRGAPPSFYVAGTGAGGAVMATPGTHPISTNNPLLSLLTSAKNSGSGGRGNRGNGAGDGGGTPSRQQPSCFRQPEYGTPGVGGGGYYGVSTVVAGPSRFQRERQRNMEACNTPHAAAADPVTVAGRVPAPAFPQQQQQQQEEAQDIILSSDEEDRQNPAAITAARNNTTGIDTPVAANVAAFGAGATAGGAPGSSGGSAGRLTGPQDSFLAGLAPPSTRVTHGNARSRLGGAGGASGSGLQGRLKRIRLADENAAAAAATAAAINNSNTNTVEAVIQACSIECDVFKVRGLCRNSQLVDFFLPTPPAAQRAELTLGRKIVIKYPYRKVAIGTNGIELFFCTGKVSAN